MVRALPGWGARLAVRVVPRSLKDRFRAAADWRVEAERRAGQQRRRAVEGRITAGAFPELVDPEVTIVIPCFNQGAFIDDALMSVFEQTFTSFEIIVVDDGSTDPDTIAHLDRLDWPRTRLVRQENQGLPGARNAGMRLAEGRFLVPLDADDEIAPEFLEVLRSAVEERPDAAYAHCWSELYGDEEATWVARPFNPYLLALSNSVVGCVLMRTEAWKQVGGYDETMIHGNEDWDMWLRSARGRLGSGAGLPGALPVPPPRRVDERDHRGSVRGRQRRDRLASSGPVCSRKLFAASKQPGIPGSPS